MSCADKEQYKILIDLLSVAKSRMEDVVNGLEPRSHLEDPLEDITFFLEGEPEIQHHFVVSMSHITHSDYQLLQKASYKSPNISADEYPYGWRVYVSPEVDEGELEALRKEGYSENFCRIYYKTKQLGCLFLCLDDDGTEYSAWETFEW